jgi:hypothetical protein
VTANPAAITRVVATVTRARRRFPISDLLPASRTNDAAGRRPDHLSANTWQHLATCATDAAVVDGIPLEDCVNAHGRWADRLTWNQSITKPLRLNLAFAVTLDGDTMTGTSRAGRLPASTVTGRRRADGAGPVRP